MRPTKLKKMKLNSVDFVRRGANQEAHIALKKSADYTPDDEEEKQSFFKSLSDSIASAIKKAFGEEDAGEYMDVTKAEHDLTYFTDVLGESFSSIMKDDSLTQEERIGMISKSMTEFNDTLDGYLSSYDIAPINKAFLEKGDDEMKIELENVDKSLLSPSEAAQLDALIEKALVTKADNEPFDEPKAGKVNPAKAQAEEEDNANLPPAVKKALQEVEEMKKSYEMKALEDVAKKYEPLGKKADEVAKTLYDLKKSGESNYNAYIAALDAQVEMVEKSGLFTEIGKSGNFNYHSVTKSEPETKIETIAKSYMEADPALDYNMAIAKAWENNPQLLADYEQQAGF